MRTKFATILAAAFSLGVVQAASAADMPVKAPVVVAAYNWTGCYVGGNGGWKSGRVHDGSANTPITTAAFGAGTITSPADSAGMTNITADSGAVGGQIGCRWQTAQRWVFGIEGDFDWTNLHGTANAVAFPGGTVFIPTDTFDFRMRWESSVRGNIGYSWDRFLVYGTAGIAFAQVTMGGNYPAAIGTLVSGAPGLYPASSGSQTKILPGATIGAGAAYAIDTHWDIGAEYRFTAYQKTDFALGTVAGVCGVNGNALVCTANPVTGHMGLQTHEVLMKLNYKFY